MSQYAQKAGKAYEGELMRYLREYGLEAERLRLTGAEDEGDLVVRYTCDTSWSLEQRVILEAKRTKGFDLAGWIKEAERERDNYDAHRKRQAPSTFVVVHKARGKGIGGSYVTTTLDEWMRNL